MPWSNSAHMLTLGSEAKGLSSGKWVKADLLGKKAVHARKASNKYLKILNTYYLVEIFCHRYFKAIYHNVMDLTRFIYLTK